MTSNEDGMVRAFDFYNATAYHMDATLFGNYLKENSAIPNGLNYITDDVIKVINYLLVNKINSTLNIATGNSIKIIEIVRLLEKEIGKISKIIYQKSRHSQFDMIFDITKLKNLIVNYNPVDMIEGVKKLIHNKQF